MLVFVTSDKGGTGRSVTSANILYRTALTGANVCYVDFDFGSPTAGAIFGVDDLARGTTSQTGMHSYLLNRVGELEFCDLWRRSDRPGLRRRPSGAGRMMLLPGDAGGGEFNMEREGMVERCRMLFRKLEKEFDLSIIDLSAGRSYALTMALQLAGGQRPDADGNGERVDQFGTDSRWLVFHRWTMQHVNAAASLVYDERGILYTAAKLGYDREHLRRRIRFVRTAFIDPNAPDMAGLRPAQLAWLQERNKGLQVLAGQLGLGLSVVLGTVPIDPVLQWHEQLITDELWSRHVANRETGEAFTDLADRLRDAVAWRMR